MKFSDVIAGASALLERNGRVSYRALRREFDLDDAALEDLRGELVEVLAVAADEGGRMLVWRGRPGDAADQGPAIARAPVDYTPAHLSDRIRAEQAAMEARAALEGERKTVTALFADVKGSTALVEDLDPEEARAILDPALQIMMDAVHRYEGYVAQVLGDGVFALFGAPIAQEDHAQRAVSAALGLREAMRRHGDALRRSGRAPLQVRIGINTGEVVVRSIRKSDLHTDYVPVGHSTHLAARMEQLAAPDSILLAPATCALVRGYFELRALGPTPVKGLDAPIEPCEVLGVGASRTRLEVSVQRGLTRFVGRRSELEQLRRALAEARAGRGQIVGVMGEAGLGKSRLLHEFKLEPGADVRMLEAFAQSHGTTVSYLPVIDLLRGYFEIAAGDDERRRREKITGKVLALDRGLDDTLPYLFGLMGVADAGAALHQLDADQRRQRTVAALKRLLLRESLDRTLVLVFEDLHWIDAETQAVLDTLAEAVAGARLLLLVNYRPEYGHAWGGKTYYTQLRLTALGEDEAQELLGFLLGEDPALAPLKRLVFSRAEGTPFFIEEVVQTLIEEGVLVGERGRYRPAEAAVALHIPATVQGVLAARIDRLEPEEKALLQQLAVIGREFPLPLAQAVVAESGDVLHRLLGALQSKEFLYERPAFPHVEYVFKHALTQEVAYGTVLSEPRKALHERTAVAIEALYARHLDDHYADLAHHYVLSGNAVKAVTYLRLSAEQAVKRAAFVEAEWALTRALALLEGLPDTPERARMELALLTALAPVYVVTQGYAKAALGEAYARARSLCAQLDDGAELIQVLAGSWLHHYNRNEQAGAFEIASEILEQAMRSADREHLLLGHYLVGQSLTTLGKNVEARKQLERAFGLYDAVAHHHLAARLGEDPGVVALAFLAQVLNAMGYPEQALRRSEEAVRLAEEQMDELSVFQARMFLGWLGLSRREVSLARSAFESLVTRIAGHETVYWSAMVGVWHAVSVAERECSSANVVALRAAYAAFERTESLVSTPYMLALLARAEARAGDVRHGSELIAEARARVARSQERWHAAEIHRIEGEIHLLDGERDAEARIRAAEGCFRGALEVAQDQSAKWWELRAAIDLARLWQSEGRVDEARALLAPVYGWFTEGFDTADLKAASALLAEIG